jgi:hypothetical protein
MLSGFLQRVKETQEKERKKSWGVFWYLRLTDEQIVLLSKVLSLIFCKVEKHGKEEEGLGRIWAFLHAIRCRTKSPSA